MTKKYGALTSSIDPNELSLTFISASKLIIGIAVSFGVIETTGANILIEQIAAVVPAGVAAYEAVNLFLGLLRKAVTSYYNKQNPQ